jgi:2-oxo-4-hydroxy-4-carboxy-5-ureidoimidazoline decarboxylase
MPDALGLAGLNAAPPDDARSAFLACCSSTRWAESMTAARPYASDGDVYLEADAALAALDEGDIDEALAGHPRIGERVGGSHGAWSRSEQSGMDAASDDTSQALAQGNRDYEARFGHVYLVCASGHSAEELLGILRERLGNDAPTERTTVRRELLQINRIRLGKLLSPADVDA